MEDFSVYNAPGTPLREAQLRMLEILKEIDKVCKKNNITYWLDGGSMLGCVRHKGFIPWDDDLDIAIFYEDYHRLLKCLQEELPSKYKVMWPGNNRKLAFNLAKVMDTKSRIDSDDIMFQREGVTGLWVDIFPMIHSCKGIRRIVEAVYGRCYRRVRGFEAENGLNRLLAYILYPFALLVVFLSKICCLFVSRDKYTNTYGTGAAPTQNATRRRSWTVPTVDMEFEGCMFPMPCNYDAILTAMYGDYMRIPPAEKRVTHLTGFEVFD